MNTTTIPKKSVKNDVVTIPRREYEALLGLKKFREFSPTAAQKKALATAEQRLRKGKTLSYYQCI
ncbi:MAG: hypothetical protein Q8R40_01310 [bacterium]|nr:hypothetical protein [bacterium]